MIHHILLHVLSEITVLTRRFGVPVPGGVAAVTGGTDSENRQRTDRAEAEIPGLYLKTKLVLHIISRHHPEGLHRLPAMQREASL